MASSSNPLIDLMLGSPSKLPNYDGINLLDKPIIFANIGDVVMVIFAKIIGLSRRLIPS